ncbi:hypothetical_protein_-_conserved [Leishmania major strain Friedlin]|nr:hypothetical_protein_-_conserved [Leishmania major strain Friedlin]
MSFMEEMSDAPVSITGEMWMCADSAGPLKVGAGRGLKNLITIEKDRFCAYSSRSEQCKQVKQIAFRSMKCVAWFAHHPKPPGREPAVSTTAATLRRGARKDPLAATYYYLVLEFLRDNTIPGTVSLGKRERIVLCTDDQQDFSIWRKFAELYECPPVHEGFVEGRDKKALRAQAPAGGARDHDDTTSSDDEGYEGRGLDGGSAVSRRPLDLWKNRCVALLNDFAHLSNPSLQVQSADVFDTPAGCGGLDWDAHVESVLHAIEQDMRPSMKVVPAPSTRGAAAGPSSLLSSPSIAPSSIHPCAATKGTMETDFDEMQSLASNLQVELEQFQVVAAEVGALAEGRELKTTTILPDALHAYVERLRKMPTPADPADSVAAQREDKTAANASAAAADLAKLESACVNAVRSFTDKVHTSALPLSQEWNREKAEQQERAALPQRVETIVAVLIDELTRAAADVSALKTSLATSMAPTTASPATNVPLELSELRRVLNQKELEVETLQQRHFHASRHTKQLSRRLEELVFSYSDVAHDMLRSQYREYASLRNLFLRALRGEVPLDNSTAAEASLGESGSFGGTSEARCSGHLPGSFTGVQKLVISAAHLEAIQALEQERIAARERQRELEKVMKELEVLRQERDEEIANLKCNFLAAGEAWEKDVAVLQAKLTALQSAIPRGALLLPASSLAAHTAVKAGIAQKLQSTQPHTPTAPADTRESTETVTPMLAESHKTLHKLTTLLATTPKETGVEAAVVTQRLQAFYDWVLEAVVPLSSTSVSDGSVLEIITHVVHAYHALFQQISTIYTATRSGTDDTHVDVLKLVKNEHEKFEKLWGILEKHLLIHGEDSSFHISGHQSSSERTALLFSSPPTMEELDQLPSFLETLWTNATLYSQLKLRSGGVPIATYLQDLEKKSAQLEQQQLQHTQREKRSLSALMATFQDDKHHTSSLIGHANSALAALGVGAPASESAAEAIARAAADAAERERALRAEVAAMEERLEAANAQQQQLQADRDEQLRDADERLAETAAAHQELSGSVADALAALGVGAPASESAAEAIARAAADAAERERALRAEVAAMEERLEAANAQQQQLQADRDEQLRDADERLAETAAAHQELSGSVADALAALGVGAPASESAAEAIARAAADAAERERALRAEVAAMEERLEAANAQQQQLQADRDEQLRDADERLAETAAAHQELSGSVADALAALGVGAPASESAAEAIARAAADAAERERALRAEVAAMEERLEAANAQQQQLQADRDEQLLDADERLAETAAAHQELSGSVADALAALGVGAPASESAAEAIARAAADAAERERALRAEVAAMEERLEAANAQQQQLQADRDEQLRNADERLAETAAAHQELSGSVADALAALGVGAPASESAAEAIARAAADAAERERALRAEVAAMEERLEAANAQQQQLQADRDEQLRDADERLAETAAAHQELSGSVADALAALGVGAPASESAAEAIARAAADAAERERALRAEVAAMEERLEAANAQQQQLQADRDEQLRDADERLAETAAAHQELSGSVADALAALGVGAPASESAAEAIARAAADAAERERALRAEVAAMEERLEAANAQQQQLQADRDEQLRNADERLAETAAAHQELSGSVADALAALGVGAPASESAAEAIARAAADAAERERALRAEVAAMEERLEAANAQQQQLQADRDEQLRDADERLAETAAAHQELSGSVADALAALGVGAPASESAAEAIARAAADAAERERALRAEVAAMEERLEAANAQQQQLQADRDEQLRNADERLAETAAAHQELSGSVADALAALGVGAPASESAAEAIARAAADAAERERALRAEVAAMEERLEAANAQQQQLQADRDEQLRDADERLAETAAAHQELSGSVADALAALGVGAPASESAAEAIARAAADAAERERALRAEVAAMEERLEAANAQQQQLQADRDEQLLDADERLAETAAAHQELSGSVADALAALGVGAPASESAAEAIARAAADAAERERALRAEVAAMEERLEAANAQQQQLQADRDEQLRDADERLAETAAAHQELSGSVADALAALGVGAPASESAAEAIARAAADAAERERALRAEVAAMEERLEAANAQQQQLQADRDEQLRDADERLAETAAAHQELSGSVADALAALGVGAPASESAAEAIARAAADAAERERALRAEVAAMEERLEAANAQQQQLQADRDEQLRDADERLAETAAAHQELSGSVADALAALGVGAPASESAAEAIARAAADAAERERALRAEVAAMEERLEAAKAQQQQLQADRDEQLRDADERLAETAAAHQELSGSVADALAALGVGAPASESAAEAIARAAADAAERERALRAEVAAMEERLEAANAQQQQLQADRDEQLRDADERLAETAAAHQELSGSVADALAALGVGAPASESAAEAIARAAADAAERERALRAEVAAMEERLEAANAQQQQLQADRDEQLRDADERLAETAAAHQELSGSVADALAALGVGAPASESAAEAIARAAADAAERERALRAEVAAMEERLEAANAQQQQLQADRDEQLRDADERLAETAAAHQELSGSVADALAALGVGAPASESAAEAIARAAADAAERERALRAEVAAMEERLEAANAQQQQLQADRDEQLRDADERLAETAAAHQELSGSVADALAALGVGAPASESAAEAIARAAADAAERERALRAEVAAMEERLEAANAQQQQLQADRDEQLRDADERLAETAAAHQELSGSVADALAALGVGAPASESAAEAIARAAADAAERERALRAEIAAMEERLEAANAQQQQLQADRDEQLRDADERLAETAAAHQELSGSVADALAALGVGAPASESAAEAIARAAADAAERERALRAEVAAMEERLEAANAQQQQLQADRDEQLRDADERLAETAAAHQELSGSVADALAALGVGAPASESAAEAIARAAADAAERERALRAEVAAMEERLEAANAQQQQLQADRDEQLRDADERLAETAAAHQELSGSVADALAALGVGAPASESAAEAIARAAADAAERERALRAEVAAMEERLEAANAQQQQLQADRDEQLRDADERLAETAAAHQELSGSVADALAALGVGAPASESAAEAIARAAADAAERERALRAEVAAMEERLEAANAQQQQLQADRDEQLRNADERLAETAAAHQELSGSVADALAALGVGAPASESAAEAIARAAADAAERERALRAEIAAMEERLEAANAQQQQLQADRDEQLRNADERLAETAAAHQELSGSVADALAALGVGAPASESAAEAIARAAADAAERERALRAEVAAMEERLEAANAQQQQLQADRDEQLRNADERLAETAAAHQELSGSVADALAALGVGAPASESAAEAIARAAADAAERERALRAEVAAMEERLEAANAQQQQLQADRDEQLRDADERLAETAAAHQELSGSVADALAALGVGAPASESAAEAIARAAADAAERERALRAEVAAMEERLEAANAQQQQLQADRDEQLRNADERLAETAAAHQELSGSVADALAALGVGAPASESAAEAIARAAADAAERERALRAEVAAMEERLEAANAQQQQLQADRDEQLRDADERLAETAAAHQELSGSVADALAALGVGAPASESAAEAIARAAADAAERERALRAEVAAMEERLEAANAQQQQLQADRDEQLRNADERLAETAAAHQELSGSVADALAALGVGAPASESAAEAIARAAADAAERERALRAEVAAMEERLEAANAQQQQLQADRDEQLRDCVRERCAYVSQVCLRELEAKEAEARFDVVGAYCALSPYVSIASSIIGKLLDIRGMVGGDVDEIVGRVRALVAELNGLRAFASEAHEKVVWYEDVRVRVPLKKLSDFVRKRDGTDECEQREEFSVSFLAETLRSSFRVLQCLDSEAMALQESIFSMTALLKECGTALNESVTNLQKALPCAASKEDTSPSQSHSTLPVEWGLRVVCRRLGATVSEAVHWQGELTNILKATYRILIATSDGTRVHGAPVSDGDHPSFAEYSQLPRLAAQACSELLHSRRFAAVEDELAAVTQQRNDLTGTVGTCCGSLCSAISVATPGRVGALPATATSLTCDEAKSALRDITVLTSSILHDYAQSMEHTLAVLTPLASIAADTFAFSSSFEMLAAATEAVRARIKRMERSQLQHLHMSQCDEEGNAKARGAMQDQLFALSEDGEAGELARRNEQEEQAAPLAEVTLQRQRWDAVAEVLGRFAEDVGATVRAKNGSESQSVGNTEVLPLVRQAISLSASAKAQEELEGRLSGILDACKRGAAEHHWAEATAARMALDPEELHASVTTGEHSPEKMQARANACQMPIATMEAARAALGQSTTQMQLVAARAHEEALDVGVREWDASESGVRAPAGEGERLGEEMYLVQSRMDAMQDRPNEAEERGSSQVMDAGVLLEAAGQVRSLEDVMRVVASYSLEYKTKSLESKESRLRSEIVQDWAVMMVPLAVELRLLRAIAAGVDRPLPGTALADLPAHGSSVRRELTEAGRSLGAAASAPCTEEATREALLGAMDQACQLLLGAPPERVLDTAAPHGTASSAEECPAVTFAGAVSTTDVAGGTAPDKLADTVYAMIEERGDRAAANGTLCTGEAWYSAVARVTQTLCSALSSAGVAVSVPADHGFVVGHSSCVSPASQTSMLDFLASAAEHVLKYTTDTTRLFEDWRESLQDCLSRTESSLPTLVAAVVEEVASLRAASQLAAEEQQHRDHELDALRTLLQEASAVFSDTSPFLSMQSPNFVEKCMAYAKECARLTALESELSSVLGAASAQRSSWEDASVSLGDLAAELQRDRVELREVEVPKLQGLVCTLSVEVLLAEERAARTMLVAEEATSRLHALCDPQLRELGFLVERALARAATAEAQCAEKTAQHCSLLAAHESLVTMASGLVPVQEDCCRALVESEGDASCAAAPTRFTSEALRILEQEAVLVPRLVQAHGRLTATCAALRSDLDAAKAACVQALADGEADLDIARSKSTELEAQLEHVLDAIEALGSLLFPHEEASLRDASCLPRLVEAAGQLAHTAAADAAARCRLERDVCDGAAAFAEQQRQCTAAESNAETLQETARRYECQEAEEIQTLTASAKTAAEAYAGIVTALCLSAESVPSAASAAAAISEEQWAAVVHAVQAAVEEGGRQTSDAAELRVEMRILQSRMAELKAAVLESEAREGNLLQRLNALMMSSEPLKAAVTAVVASRECNLESLEDVALAMQAAVQLVERQQGNINQLIAGGGDLHSGVESLNGRLCGVAKECDVTRPSLASLEETHGMLQRRMAQLERHVHDTISTVDCRAVTVLGAAELRRLDKSTPADCLDGIAYVADALACRAEECDAAKAQLLAWRAEERIREEASLRTTTRLSTLWQAFRTALLPLLVDEPADRGGCGEVAVFSADPVEFLASEAEARQAAQMIVDTAERLRRTHNDLQAVYAALRGHFGGDAATGVREMTATPHAPARVLHNSGVTSLRFDDTVTATLHLVSTVVNAKCTSVKDFIDHVVSDVLRDTSGSARVSFAALRPGAFAERLQGVLASLRALRESSDQHRDRARRLPAFMDALVETIHSHGGRVDVASTDATGALAIADATMPYRHSPATTLEDCQAREQRAIVHGLQALLNQQEERVRALTAEWQCVKMQYHQLSQEQVAAEETVVELRRRVQFKVQEDYKLEESLRELDSHLDQQARELSMRYFADQDAIVRRFTLLRNQIHAAMRLPTRRSASAMPPRTPGRDTSTPRS